MSCAATMAATPGRKKRQPPTDFGFVIDVNANKPNRPSRRSRATEHYLPDGKLRVSQQDRWERMGSARERSAPERLLRQRPADAMAVDTLDKCGVYFGTTGGQVYASADEGDNWARLCATCRSPSRCRHSPDPRGAAGASAHAGRRRRRSDRQRRGAGRCARCSTRSGRARAPRDDSRLRHRTAAAFPSIFCLRAGWSHERPDARAARRGGIGRKVHGCRRDIRRRTGGV